MLKRSISELSEAESIAQARLSAKTGQVAEMDKRAAELKIQLDALDGAKNALAAARINRDGINYEIVQLDKRKSELFEENAVLVKQYGVLKSKVLQAQRQLEELFRYQNALKGEQK